MEPKETPEMGAPEGKKMYKGTMATVKELAEQPPSPRPIQPISTSFKINGATFKVPPSFILTRLTPGYVAGTRIMYYYSPVNKIRSQVQVPDDLQLNVLSGGRGEELEQDFKATLKDRLDAVSRRLVTTVGADPEVFITGKSGVVPAWTFLGSKGVPSHYKTNPEGFSGTAYWDGFQAEFTTPGNVTCLMQLSSCIRGGLQAIKSHIPRGGELSLASVVSIDPEVLEKAEEHHVAFGCMPSMNVYGLKGNTQEGRVVPYRFAGGHIHLGLTDHQKPRIPEFVRALDTVLGVATVSLFAGYDDPIRRQFYGLAGEYRTPPHGMEYRVLSNAWLAHPVVMHLVFDLCRAVVGFVDEGYSLDTVWDAKEEETIGTIMASDVGRAREILRRNEKSFRGLLRSSGSSYLGHAEGKAWDAWTQGMDSFLKNPRDIVGNWDLNSDSGWAHSTRKMFLNLVQARGKL